MQQLKPLNFQKKTENLVTSSLSESLNTTQKALIIRDKSNNWILLKLKFCFPKILSIKLKSKPDWGKIFASYVSDKGLVFRIQEELNPIKAEQKT